MGDRVVLLVDGKELGDWTSYDIDSNMAVDADFFSLSVDAFRRSDLDLLAPYSQVDVIINDCQQMKGLIERVDAEVGRDSSRLTVSGRSLAALLVDSSPPPGRYADVTILELAADLAASFGVEVATTTSARQQAANTPGMDRRPPVDTVLSRAGIAADDLRTQPGDSVWGFIAGLAEKLGLHVWMDPDGTLIIGLPTYDAEPNGYVWRALPDGKRPELNNVLDGGMHLDWSGRFSEITKVGQRTVFGERLVGVVRVPTSSQVRFSSTETDGGFLGKEYKPLRASSSAPNAATLQAETRLDMQTRLYQSEEYRYTVFGHSQGRMLWQPDMMAICYDEKVGLDDVLYLTGRRFTRSRTGGTRTQLTLRRPNIWLAA